MGDFLTGGPGVRDGLVARCRAAGSWGGKLYERPEMNASPRDGEDQHGKCLALLVEFEADYERRRLRPGGHEEREERGDGEGQRESWPR